MSINPYHTTKILAWHFFERLLSIPLKLFNSSTEFMILTLLEKFKAQRQSKTVQNRNNQDKKK